MPDLQSELSKVINDWEAPEVPKAPETLPQRFKVTNNVSRATFEQVKNHPGLPRMAAVRALMAQGYKKASTTSLLVQMVRQGHIRETNGVLFTNQPEYTPIKPRLVKAAQTARKAPPPAPAPEVAKPKRKYVRRNAAAKAAAYEAHENYNPTAFNQQPKVVAPPEFNAEDFVNGLTLKQAKAVYSALKKVFE